MPLGSKSDGRKLAHCRILMSLTSSCMPQGPVGWPTLVSPLSCFLVSESAFLTMSDEPAFMLLLACKIPFTMTRNGQETDLLAVRNPGTFFGHAVQRPCSQQTLSQALHGLCSASEGPELVHAKTVGCLTSSKAVCPLLGSTIRIAFAMRRSSLAPSWRLPNSLSLALEISSVGVL